MDSTTLKPEPPSSPSLGYAVACGLPVRMSYSVDETSMYSGLSVKQLRRAMESGELDFKRPSGTLRGARIPVTAMDAYMSPR